MNPAIAPLVPVIMSSFLCFADYIQALLVGNHPLSKNFCLSPDFKYLSLLCLVPDKFRDNEEGTTSDTTIDSPAAHTSMIRNGTPDNLPAANGNHLTAAPTVGGSEKSGRKHKKPRHAKENGTAEQQRLCKGHQLNGSIEHQQLNCDRVSHPTNRANHCSKNHAFLGTTATNMPNGHHYMDGSLECNV